MSVCECGCGKKTNGAAVFRQGHDAKVRREIEQKVGGVLMLRELVEAAHQFAAGEITAKEYHRITRLAISNGS